MDVTGASGGRCGLPGGPAEAKSRGLSVVSDIKSRGMSMSTDLISRPHETSRSPSINQANITGQQQRRFDEDVNLPLIKVVVLGAPAVGKTSVVKVKALKNHVKLMSLSSLYVAYL